MDEVAWLDAGGKAAGSIVDEVAWLDAGGKAIKSIARAKDGAQLQARVRVVSGLPLAGTVRVVVRKDAPGLAQAGDAALAEGSVEVDIDPQAYVVEPRTSLTVPFVADMAGAQGFYVDVLFGDEARPAFTTSWDLPWTVPDLDVDAPRYTANFGTCGSTSGRSRSRGRTRARGRSSSRSERSPAGGTRPARRSGSWRAGPRWLPAPTASRCSTASTRGRGRSRCRHRDALGASRSRRTWVHSGRSGQRSR
ncbi:MAG: hypothetical protein FJ087_23825 [Deltaproteobacteria bacterium]|nr:hypothetical protein [Deltaproteobacteria bacterium]